MRTKKSRGFPLNRARRRVTDSPFFLALEALLSRTARGDLPSDVPHKSAEFACNSGGHFVVTETSCLQATKARKSRACAFQRGPPQGVVVDLEVLVAEIRQRMPRTSLSKLHTMK
jgi:hypothetical protein